MPWRDRLGSMVEACVQFRLQKDMLLNNLAESFNAWIKDASDKSMVTMLEMIW